MKITRIDESEIDRYLERAAHHSKPNGLVADGIKIIEQLIRENSRLRKAAAVRQEGLFGDGTNQPLPGGIEGSREASFGRYPEGHST